MFVAKSDKSSPVILQQHVVKHGSHDQSTHSPKKGGNRTLTPNSFNPQIAGIKTSADSFANNVKRGDMFDAELKSGASVRGIALENTKMRPRVVGGQPEPSVRFSGERGGTRVLFDSDIKEVTNYGQKKD